jgi:hypothetical protein
MLSRSVNEDLDFWETPFLHLGGAGTHYPRKDVDGHVLPKRNTWNVKQIGPLDKRIVRVENTVDGRWEFITDMDLSAFQGEWFDAYDVQGYLEERWGCRIDAKSSFAEFAVDEETALLSGRVVSSDEDDETPGLTHSVTSSSGADEARQSEYGVEKHLSVANRMQAESMTPPFSNVPFGLDMPLSNPPHAMNPAFSNMDVSFDQTLGLDLAPGYDYIYPSFDVDTNMGLDLMGGQAVKRTKKKMAWLEVERLIDGEWGRLGLHSRETNKRQSSSAAASVWDERPDSGERTLTWRCRRHWSRRIEHSGRAEMALRALWSKSRLMTLCAASVVHS